MIALLTDFGTRDYFVAAMKGVILSIAPTAVMIDITHEIEPQNIRQAYFTLSACHRDMPPGTIFVAVVDPGVGTNRRPILVETGRSNFIGPDNGIFGFALGEARRVVELSEQRFHRNGLSTTFDGRDVFAPVAGHLAAGVMVEEFGPEVRGPVQMLLPEPVVEGDVIRGEVLHIDRFGNLITNLTNESLRGGMAFEIAGRRITRHCSAYAEAPDSQPFAIRGSAGFVEICVNRGSAADVLGAAVGTGFTAMDSD